MVSLKTIREILQSIADKPPDKCKGDVAGMGVTLYESYVGLFLLLTRSLCALPVNSEIQWVMP